MYCRHTNPWLLLLVPFAAMAIDDGLARTPPMGWNPCNHFGWGNSVNETLIRQCVDSIVSSGMKAAGYTYINLDAGWCARDRDASGNFVASPSAFPSGIKALADYVHARGLRFGIYTDAGDPSCGNSTPGSKNHEYQDARLFASWGVDYIKNDFCNSEGLRADSIYGVMRDAVKAAGRPMVLEICEWGTNMPWGGWGKQAGHLWRTTTDMKPVTPCWDCQIEPVGPWGPVPIAEVTQRLWSFAGPGGWNFMDMMSVGNGLTVAEDRAQFSLFCIMASPIIAGHDPRNMSADLRAIVTNREMIAVNQDSLGAQGRRVWIDTANSVIDRGGKVISGANLQVFVKPMRDSSRAVVLFNKGAAAADITVLWTQMGWQASVHAAVRDLWGHRDLGTASGQYTANVGSHDAAAFCFTPQGVGVAYVPRTAASGAARRVCLAVQCGSHMGVSVRTETQGLYDLCGRRVGDALSPASVRR